MEAYTETILKRNALSKLRLAERRLNGIENIVTEAEMRFLANDQKNQKSVLESIASVIALLQQQEKDMNTKLETNLKELTSKQEYMNKYLPKCKLFTFFLIGLNWFPVQEYDLLIVCATVRRCSWYN